MTSLPPEPDPLVVPETVTSETDTPLVPETVFQLDGPSQVESLDGESFASSSMPSRKKEKQN